MNEWSDLMEDAFNEGADAYGASAPRNPYTGLRQEMWARGYHMMFLADPGDDWED